MANPTPRGEGINNLLNALSEKDHNQTITQNVCVICGKPAIEFTDELSKKEYVISGLCQNCQNIAFAEDDDES